MPLLKLETTANLSDQSRTDLLTKLSRIVAETIGKPEQYVMVTVSHGDILMSGQPGHAAFVDLRSIGGLSGDTNRKLTERICDVLEESLAIPPDRIYVTFTDVQASNWGWNGRFPKIAILGKVRASWLSKNRRWPRSVRWGAPRMAAPTPGPSIAEPARAQKRIPSPLHRRVSSVDPRLRLTGTPIGT